MKVDMCDVLFEKGRIILQPLFKKIGSNRPKTGKLFEKQDLSTLQKPQEQVIKNWICLKTVNKHNWSVCCIKLIRTCKNKSTYDMHAQT